MKKAAFLWLGLALFACQPEASKKEKEQASSKEDKKEHAHGNQQSAEKESFDCANCGMPANEYPKWNVKFEGNDGKTFYTCSPKCMFSKLVREKEFSGSFKTAMLSDYYEQKRIPAKEAFFVIQSDVAGPMGNDFVPLKDQKSAEDFKKEHKGGKIVKFSEVDENLLKEAASK